MYQILQCYRRCNVKSEDKKHKTIELCEKLSDFQRNLPSKEYPLLSDIELLRGLDATKLDFNVLNQYCHQTGRFVFSNILVVHFIHKLSINECLRCHRCSSDKILRSLVESNLKTRPITNFIFSDLMLSLKYAGLDSDGYLNQTGKLIYRCALRLKKSQIDICLLDGSSQQRRTVYASEVSLGVLLILKHRLIWTFDKKLYRDALYKVLFIEDPYLTKYATKALRDIPLDYFENNELDKLLEDIKSDDFKKKTSVVHCTHLKELLAEVKQKKWLLEADKAPTKELFVGFFKE